MEKERPILPQNAPEKEGVKPGLTFIDAEFSGYCEGCHDSYIDRRLTISVDGVEVNSFFEDGHKGESNIYMDEVEDYVSGLLHLSPETLLPLAETRVQLEQQIQELYEVEGETDYQMIDSLQETLDGSFYSFLKELGFSVTYEKTESSYDSTPYDYDDDFEYGEDS